MDFKFLKIFNKVFLIYKTPFWIEDGFSGEVVTSGGPSYTLGCERGPVAVAYDATTYKGTPALVCFVAGKKGDQWLDKSEADLKAAILVSLICMF